MVWGQYSCLRGVFHLFSRGEHFVAVETQGPRTAPEVEAVVVVVADVAVGADAVTPERGRGRRGRGASRGGFQTQA